MLFVTKTLLPNSLKYAGLSCTAMFHVWRMIQGKVNSLSMLCLVIVLCDSVCMVCDSVCMVCDSVSMLCDSVCMVCDSVSMSCESVSMPCDSVSMPCDSVSMPYESVSMMCFHNSVSSFVMHFFIVEMNVVTGVTWS